MSYSQNNEEEAIRDYFSDKPVGRFLDIGAGDGVTFSNTKMLYDKGWGGVAIEPSPTLFDNLKKNLDGNRVTMIKKALSNNKDSLTFYHAPNDFVSTTIESHKAKWQSVVKYEKIQVETIIWDEIAEYGKFDFINLDIEGNNIQMLKLIPSKVLRSAKLLCIEYDGQADYIRTFLQPFGFAQIMLNGENIIMGHFGEK